MTSLHQQIEQEIAANKVILYMKGTKLMPACGFSSQVVHILNTLGVAYATRNVLDDDGVRAAIKEYSNWPTLPQLYIDGKFIGGCDIVTQLYENGQLKELLDTAHTAS